MSRPSEHQVIHLGARCAAVPETGQPRVVAHLADYQFEVARLDGDFIVPARVRRRPRTGGEVRLVLIGPRGVVNTGSEGGEKTTQRDLWIQLDSPGGVDARP